MVDISASEFKAHCLRLLDQVAATREPLVITKHGRPVAQVVPMPEPARVFGVMQGSVLFSDNLIEPVNVDWDAAPDRVADTPCPADCPTRT